ncbi:MAG: signal peptidase I [Hyphomicrobiales bacterium]|nr:MAG: signal peptidase I [Hyphomicrobiales bacterium]
MSAQTHNKTEESWWETIRVVIYALLLALFVRTLFFQPFNIPSGSMIPTLLVGDYLFVSKYSYGYSKYSIPLSPPLFNGRIWGAQPKRGDVAVFKLPRDNSSDYIKRIIGLPGDRVQMRDGVLHINGKPVDMKPIADFPNRDLRGQVSLVPQLMETLPGGVKHKIIDIIKGSFTDNTPEFTVPENHYFMMGDNRDNSSDSRVPGGGVGFVPFENLIGKAQIIFFSIQGDTRFWQIWRWPAALRWNRMFRPII